MAFNSDMVINKLKDGFLNDCRGLEDLADEVEHGIEEWKSQLFEYLKSLKPGGRTLVCLPKTPITRKRRKRKAHQRQELSDADDSNKENTVNDFHQQTSVDTGDGLRARPKRCAFNLTVDQVNDKTETATNTNDGQPSPKIRRARAARTAAQEKITQSILEMSNLGAKKRRPLVNETFVDRGGIRAGTSRLVSNNNRNLSQLSQNDRSLEEAAVSVNSVCPATTDTLMADDEATADPPLKRTRKGDESNEELETTNDKTQAKKRAPPKPKRKPGRKGRKKSSSIIGDPDPVLNIDEETVFVFNGEKSSPKDETLKSVKEHSSTSQLKVVLHKISDSPVQHVNSPKFSTRSENTYIPNETHSENPAVSNKTVNHSEDVAVSNKSVARSEDVSVSNKSINHSENVPVPNEADTESDDIAVPKIGVVHLAIPDKSNEHMSPKAGPSQSVCSPVASTRRTSPRLNEKKKNAEVSVVTQDLSHVLLQQSAKKQYSKVEKHSPRPVFSPFGGTPMKMRIKAFEAHFTGEASTAIEEAAEEETEETPRAMPVRITRSKVAKKAVGNQPAVTSPVDLNPPVRMTRSKMALKAKKNSTGLAVGVKGKNNHLPRQEVRTSLAKALKKFAAQGPSRSYLENSQTESESSSEMNRKKSAFLKTPMVNHLYQKTLTSNRLKELSVASASKYTHNSSSNLNRSKPFLQKGSFLSAKTGKTPAHKPGSNIVSGMSSFIVSLQAKPTAEEVKEHKEEDIKRKLEKEEEAKRKREEHYQKRRDEIKRKNEEKMLRVQKAKEEKLKEEQEKKIKLAEMQKQREEKLKEEAAKKKLLGQQKQIEAEERKKQEEEQKLLALKKVENERVNKWLKECDVMKQQELQVKHNQYKQAQLQMKSPQPPPTSTVAQQLNTTYTAPPPKKGLKDENNYDITNICSDDSSDEERSKPKKPIPLWATKENINKLLERQFNNPIPVDQLFGMKPTTIDLDKVFEVKKKRFYKRTSSAVWATVPQRF